MTSTQWPHQHFKLLSFLDHPYQRINYHKRLSDKNKNLWARGPTGLCAAYDPAFPTIVKEETFLSGDYFLNHHYLLCLIK